MNSDLVVVESLGRPPNPKGATPAREFGDEYSWSYVGTTGQLRRAGVPEAWLRDLPRSAVALGERTTYDGNRFVTVSWAPRRKFIVLVTHIKYFLEFGGELGSDEASAFQAFHQAARHQSARPSHLRLVWSAPA